MKRLAPALVLAALVAGIAAAAAQAAPQATCSPEDCGTWQPGPVTLTWTDPDTGETVSCQQTVVDTESPDSNGTVVRCNDRGPGRVTVFIDKTPPVIGSVSPGPDHNGWYNHPVSLAITGSDALSGLGGPCQAALPGSVPDGRNVTAGTCTDLAGNTARVLINFDATAPAVTGATAGRPPDHNGWYTHPVTFTFSGTDRPSGMARCDSVTYAGPDDANATVSGSCTDNAGNTGRGSQTFSYDATRPAPPGVRVTPGNHRVRLTWTLPPDATSVTVMRSKLGSRARPKVIYSGSRKSIVDKGLRNGTKYRYVVRDVDRAGNMNRKAVRAIPTASSLRPFVGTVVDSPPLLTWRKVKGARYYNVQLFFGSKKVLSTWPRTPSLQLNASWHFRGQAYTLVPGQYRWYVWPGFGPLSAHNYGDRIGRSSFRVRG